MKRSRLSTNFHTPAEADPLIPQALAVVYEVIRRLPPGLFGIDPGTLFIARGTPHPVACFAAGLVEFRFQVAPVEFDPNQPVAVSVEDIVNSLLQWHARVRTREVRPRLPPKPDASSQASVPSDRAS